MYTLFVQKHSEIAQMCNKNVHKWLWLYSALHKSGSLSIKGCKVASAAELSMSGTTVLSPSTGARRWKYRNAAGRPPLLRDVNERWAGKLGAKHSIIPSFSFSTSGCCSSACKSSSAVWSGSGTDPPSSGIQSRSFCPICQRICGRCERRFSGCAARHLQPTPQPEPLSPAPSTLCSHPLSLHQMETKRRRWISGWMFI